MFKQKKALIITLILLMSQVHVVNAGVLSPSEDNKEQVKANLFPEYIKDEIRKGEMTQDELYLFITKNLLRAEEVSKSVSNIKKGSLPNSEIRLIDLELIDLQKPDKISEGLWEANLSLLSTAEKFAELLRESGETSPIYDDPLQILSISKHEVSARTALDKKMIVNSGISLATTEVDKNAFLLSRRGETYSNGDGPYQIINSDMLNKAKEFFPSHISDRPTFRNPVDSLGAMMAFIKLNFSKLDKIPELDDSQKYISMIMYGYNSGPAVVNHIATKHDGNYKECNHSTGLSWIDVPYVDILAMSVASSNDEIRSIIQNKILNEGYRSKDLVNDSEVWNTIVDAYMENPIKSNKLDELSLRKLNNKRGKTWANLGSGYGSQAHRLKYAFYQMICYEVNSAFLEGKISTTS